MSITQFDKIYHGMSSDVGKFRMANQGVAWKALEGDAQVAIPQDEIKWAEWIRVARNFQLRIGLSLSKQQGKDAETLRETFDGFQRDDQEKVAKLLKQLYDITLDVRPMTFKGWNWGATDFRGQDLTFMVSNKTVFEVPLTAVTNSNIAGRTEVSLEFAHQAMTNGAGKKSARAPDELVEMRFYVPGSRMRDAESEDGSGDEAKKKKSKKESADGEGEEKSDKEGSGKEDGDKDDEEDGDDDQNAAQQFHTLIRERASLTSQTAAGSLLVSFDEVMVATPRGRYDVAMFQSFLRLRGKTYDYKILYTSITRLFLLPKDDRHVQFIIGLNPPIRQGQTRYSYLVMQFARDQEMEAEINMDQETIDEKYTGKLEKHYEGPAFQVVSSVFRALSGKKIIGQTRDEAHGIKCNLKANPGEIHLLEKSVIFIGKQPILIEHGDIHQVLFSRVGNALGTARTFDLSIETKGGHQQHTFSAINRDEHELMHDYLKGKKVRITNQMADDVLNDLIGEDDSDEEMQSVASSGSEEPTVRRGADVDDEDSEEDEDFQASSTDGGSPSSGSEGDSDAGQGDSGDEEVAKAKAKAKSKEASKTKEKAKAADKPKEKGKGKGDDKPKAKSKDKGKGKASSDVESPPAKKKKATTEGEKPKARPKPKPVKDADAMDVDEEPPKSSKSDLPAKPRPKPKPAGKAAEEGPAKKKLKKESPVD